MKSLYERMGGTYRQEGDYFVPNLALPDTGYAGFEKQWTVKEKPVTNYGDEKIFTVTYSGDLSKSEFKAWWRPRG